MEKGHSIKAFKQGMDSGVILEILIIKYKKNPQEFDKILDFWVDCCCLMCDLKHHDNLNKELLDDFRIANSKIINTKRLNLSFCATV